MFMYLLLQDKSVLLFGLVIAVNIREFHQLYGQVKSHFDDSASNN